MRFIGQVLSGFWVVFFRFLHKNRFLDEPDVVKCRDVRIKIFRKSRGFRSFGDVVGCRGEIHSSTSRHFWRLYDNF